MKLHALLETIRQTLRENLLVGGHLSNERLCDGLALRVRVYHLLLEVVAISVSIVCVF